MEEDKLIRPTMSIPDAGRKFFGLGRNASYAAATRGEIPVIRIGGRVFAAVAPLERMIDQAGDRATDAVVQSPVGQAGPRKQGGER